MTTGVDALEAQDLIERGVRVVDVLPAKVFAKEHLPSAVNVPLETFDPSQFSSFDRSAGLLVYCFDQH
jgi:rhodanese-related sulfurtransferase